MTSIEPPENVGAHLAPPSKVPTAILLMLAGLLIAAAMGGWVAFIAADRSRTIHQTMAELSRQSGLLREHAHRTIEASDLVLQRVVSHLRGGDLSALRGSEALYRDLQEMGRGLPQLGSLWVLDDTGAVVASSLQPKPVGGNLADRTYFRVYADDQAGDGPFIGEIMVGRQTGMKFFSIARALRASDGTLRGVAMAAIHSDYFQSFYQSLGFGEGGSVAILRSDGALLVREPLPDSMIGIRIPLPATGLSPDTPVVVAVNNSPFDGSERIIARRLVPGYPLVVLASRTTTAAMAGWRARAVQSGLAGAAVTVAGLLLAVIGLRALRRQRAMEVQLREARTTLEDRVRERTASLSTANINLEHTVAERNLLLREVYHRVKNNLQQVDALIALQIRGMATEEARRALSDTRLRINALGMVHQQLIQSTDLETFTLQSFLQDLCGAIAFSVGAASRGIVVRIEAEPMTVDLDIAIPLGLLINELIANALRHAFPDGRKGTILVQARREDPRMIVSVTDDGVGYDGDATIPGSTGSRIIEALTRQLCATMTVYSGHGTRCELSIPLEKEMLDA